VTRRRELELAPIAILDSRLGGDNLPGKDVPN